MKILAVDYGDTRTGLAMCDRTEFLASPIGIITEKSMPKVAEKIVYTAREYEADMIVIGLPLNMDGSEGPRAEKTRKLAGILHTLLPLPIELWDERSTTVTDIGPWAPKTRACSISAVFEGPDTKHP